jgi:NodT family efflux transporter outer membrane factor (OMF) lipoprotein
MNKKFIFSLLICFIFSQSGVYAFWWNHQKININPQEKIGYVNIDWWENYSDPILTDCITKAIENNHDAKKASWQVEEYKQMVKYQFASELPSLSVGTSYVGLHIPTSIMPDYNKNIFAVPFIASYEADVFLKNHDKTKSSKKAYEASKFQEKSIYISLAADVATVYLNIVKFDELISLQKEILKNKKEILKRAEAQYKQGVISIPEVNDTKKELKKAQNTLKDYIKSRDTLLTELLLLTGDSAYNIQDIKRNSINNIKYSKKIPKEITSDVIFSRPDLMAAEANLEKAKIDVRVARKEFLPSVNVNALYSLSSLGGANFFSWESAIAAILAGMTFDIFKGGMKVANLKVNKARYEQIFETYKQTDLNALKEVKDSLLIIKQDSEIDENTIFQSNIQADNFKRAEESNQRGLISVQNLLLQKEQFLIMTQNKISSKTNRLIDYITLYKAVGGNL